MLKAKNYLKLLFLLLGTILFSAFVYLYFYNQTYPLPLTNRVSIDAKIKFIKEHIDRKKVDTIIVGSSIGLNNIQGDVLEKTSHASQSVLNLSAFELRAAQVEQVLELITLFPNLKRVIYSVQFSDFSASDTISEYYPELIKKYIENTLDINDQLIILGNTYKNVFNCIDRQFNWKKKHTHNNKFTYLGFDHTGSVHLDIYDKDIIKNRWEVPHPKTQNKNSFMVLEKIAKKLRKKNIHFYVVLEPYRAPLIQEFKYLQPTMDAFAKHVKSILKNDNGTFVNMHQIVQFDDSHFADRSHLNSKGSEIIAKELAKQIDNNKE
jgi:hypothetical protein